MKVELQSGLIFSQILIFFPHETVFSYFELKYFWQLGFWSSSSTFLLYREKNIK